MFGYSDGKEVEDRVRRILLASDDVGSGSIKLRKEISDWPSLYHLSPTRRNLLLPFAGSLKGNVLEIGAGCGALTRFLGECGGSVAAIEGSTNRAAAAAARCRDLSNVRVFVEAFDRLKPAPVFDVVTLIGVLEYARAYFPAKEGEDPVNALLMHASRFLAPGGVMFLAIENQMGLKYFAGSGEDHVGVPFFGLEDRYTASGSCVTFGRRELQTRLNDAGLTQQSWWFPFPDYKFPSVVASEDLLLRCGDVGLGGLIQSAAERDPQAPAHPSFSVKKAWGPVLRNGMGGDLANSFLVIAGSQGIPVLPGLGYHFSSDRRPEFSKTVVFYKGRGGRFQARSEKTCPNVHAPADCPLSMSLEDGPVLVGDHGMDRLQRILGEPGWSVSSLVLWARPWIEAFAKESGIALEPSSSGEAIKIPGRMLDAVPRNVVFTSDGIGRFFDLEWTFAEPLEWGFLLFRGIFLSLLACGPVESPSPGTTLRAVDIYSDIARTLGFPVGDQDVRRYCELEQLIQRWATDTDGPQFDNVCHFQLPLLKRMGAVVAEQREEISKLKSTMTGSPSSHADRLSTELKERDSQIQGLHASLAEANGRMAALSLELTARLEEAARLSGSLSSRDEQVFKLNAVLAESNGRMEALSRALASQTEETKAVSDRLGMTINEKDSQILGLQTSLAEANGRMEALSRALASQTEETKAVSDRLGMTINEKDSQILGLQACLAEANGRMAAMSSELTARLEETVRLSGTISSRDEQVNKLNASLAESNGRMEELSRNLEIRTDEMKEVEDRLGRSLAEKDFQITALAASSNDLRRKVESYGGLMEGQSKELRRLVDSQAAATDESARLKALLEEEKSSFLRAREELEQSKKMVDSVSAEIDFWRRKSELLELDLMRVSDWASRIHNNPMMYGFKKSGYQLGRAMLKGLPMGESQRQSLRQVLLAVSRRFRGSAQRAVVDTRRAPPPAFSASAMELSSDQDVLIFSIIDWHFRFQRPQHLAKSLAKKGRRVFFFSNHFVDSPDAGYAIEPLNKQGNLFQVKLHVKGAPPIYFSAPGDDAVGSMRASLARVLLEQGIVSSLALVQHPYWFPLAKDIPNTFRVYDCMDHHEGFGNVPVGLVKIEREMMLRSDLVVVTSSWLQQFAEEFTPNVAMVRNAAEYRHFVDPPSDVFKDSKGRKIIGYYGAIADWFDVDLVRGVAESCPDCLVLLVGDDTRGAGQALNDVPNVSLTGEVPYSKLPYYLHSFDVCMLPFRVIPLTQATNPVKVYEYLAAGKPVVSVDLPELSQFGRLIERSQTKGQFISTVRRVVQAGGGGSRDIEKRKRFASQQTWDHRIAEFFSAWDKRAFPKISVVVLTYNQWELSEACLRSLVDETDYPNLEIVIVDNASTDGTPSRLRLFAENRLNVKVVLNDKNLGFAGGNNVGLAAASGDYLVLLNNDTVVTRGWATTLWRHLEDNPKIGLIGPVTNNIGNEARVEIGYASLADMPQEARRYTIPRMGKIFPIRTTAFFCAMMSRKVFEKVGPLCEEYGRGFFEDDDYCRRVEKAGYTIVCADDVFVHHHLSASFNKLSGDEKKALFDKNKAVYEGKWGPWVPHAYR